MLVEEHPPRVNEAQRPEEGGSPQAVPVVGQEDPCQTKSSQHSRAVHSAVHSKIWGFWAAGKSRALPLSM